MNIKKKIQRYFKSKRKFFINSKRQFVEYYVQHDKLYFGIDENFYSSVISRHNDYNATTRSSDVRISFIDCIPTKIPKSDVMLILSNAEKCISHEPDYVEKRYAFDSEDLIEINEENATIGCILRKNNEIFMVVDISIESTPYIKLLDLEYKIEIEINPLQLSEYECYRCRSLKLFEQ